MFGKRGNDDGNRGKPDFRPPAPQETAVATAPPRQQAVAASTPVAPQQRRPVEAPPMAPAPKATRARREG